MPAPSDLAEAAKEAVRNIIHEVAQPLSTAALALDVAALLDDRGTSSQRVAHIRSAVEAVARAQAILSSWAQAAR